MSASSSTAAAAVASPLPHPLAREAEFRALSRAAAAASSRSVAATLRKRLVLRIETRADDGTVSDLPVDAIAQSLVFTGPADASFGWEFDVVQNRLLPIIMDAHAFALVPACFTPLLYPDHSGTEVRCACGRISVTAQIDDQVFVFSSPDMPPLERPPPLVLAPLPVPAAVRSLPPPPRARPGAAVVESSSTDRRPISPSTGLPTWRSKTTSIKQLLAIQAEQKARRFAVATADASAATTQPAPKRYTDLSRVFKWTSGTLSGAAAAAAGTSLSFR